MRTANAKNNAASVADGHKGLAREEGDDPTGTF